MVRAVVDTNVFVSGLLTEEGVAGRVVTAWKENKFVLIISEEIIKEIIRALNYPQVVKVKPQITEEVKPLVDLILKYAVVMPGNLDVDLVPDDPKDNKFAVAAIEGGADFIVSSDKHLLNLKKIKGIKVLNPGQFLNLL